VNELSIGQLADAAGVHVETIRYYERRGLIAEPPRTPAGYRQYSADDVWRLQFIGRAKRLGFTLAEIDDLIGEHRAGASDRVVAAARAKITAVDQTIEALRATRARLEQLLDVCADGDGDDCAALNLSC
jgi:DNA-binding transcriptional MerR regulator